MRFNVGIVGCGRIAGIKDAPRDSGFVGTHALAYYRHPLFDIKAVVCPHRYKIFQKIWNIPNGYTELDKMLDNEKLDVVSVCSPNEYHYPHLCKILKSDSCPRIIFAEKPVCLRPSELQTLKRLVAETKCKVIVNHSRRYDPGHIKVRQLIKSRELGKLLYARCDYYGGWFHNGCHAVDTLRMLLDDEPRIEQVELGPPGKVKDPCLNVKLLLNDSHIDIIGFDERHYQLYEWEFRFENGRILLQDFGRRIIVEKVEIDSIDDRVLVPVDQSPWKGFDSPLLHAIDLIAKYLIANKSLSGYGVLLDEVTGTMNILWKARERYDKYSEKEGENI